MVRGGGIGRAAATAVAAVIGLCSAPAHAQVEVRTLLEALRVPDADAGATPPRELSNAFRAARTGLFSVLVELPRTERPRDHGLVAVAPGFAALEAAPDEIARVAKAHPDWQLTWSPPRRPMLDRAAEWIRLPRTDPAGPRGRGVVVGIVDTGIDPTHYDLRDQQRKSRVRWLLDFSRAPAGRHPELEEEYGCTGTVQCAIFDNADLDALNENEIDRDEPQDTFGHGTHVASLAAGSGLANVTAENSVPKYAGAAPEATLISVRATRASGGSIFDADILRATRFIFEQAERLGMPAVVNLSLGSEFGSHDGSAALERGLAALLEPDIPGRSIVVAAGNSAGVQFNVTTDYPEPLGIHTELHVPRHSAARVPLLTPPSLPKGQRNEGTIFVWITFRPGDELEVGVDDDDETIMDPLEPGRSGTVKQGELSVTVLNGTHGGSSPISTDTNAAVVILDGKWVAGSPFAITLRGHGTARLWVQSEGDIGPNNGSSGALFPRAYKASTVSIPASHPLLIAVGATLNRVEWPVHTGKHMVKIDQLGALQNPPEDTLVYFSGAGPSANGLIKPDIVAPGAFVVGAMSRLADPRTNGLGIFGATERCRQPDGSVVECNVVDAWHAVTSGTSMAAPLVAGGIALLLERNPRLTQRQIIDLLQGGARKPQGLVPVEEQLGPGALDVTGALSALEAGDTGAVREPSLSQSWLALASTLLRPDPDWPLAGSVLVRDESGAPADNFGFERLRLDPGGVLIKEPLRRVAPGLFRFAIAAPTGSGGQRAKVRILLDDQVLAERDLPIAVDRSLASGSVDARGGCSFAPGAGAASALWVGLLALLLRRRRRAQSFTR
jgi:subtilisin family serine protease